MPKLPVESCAIGTEGLEGDVQRYRRIHGGPLRAVCMYSWERIEALRREGHPIGPGTTGENLTIEGLDWTVMAPGTLVTVGAVRLELTAFADPCKTIRPSFADGNSTRISQDKHPGWSRLYARVLVAGTVRAGDDVAAEAPERPRGAEEG